MHLYVLARGQADRMQRWINDLNAQYLPFKHPALKKEGKIQLSVREMKLLEICFPEEQLDEVLKIVRPQQNLPYFRLIRVLRRFLGKVEDCPAYDTKGVNSGDSGVLGTGWSFYRVLNDSVAVHAIGIKRDKRDEKGTELI
jgi:hypothetical protein